MKAILLLCALFCALLLSGTNAEELPQGQTAEESASGHPTTVRANRQRRVTCDLMSWGGFGHSLCAAHCVAMMKGFRGGFCNNEGVCVCRK